MFIDPRLTDQLQAGSVGHLSLNAWFLNYPKRSQKFMDKTNPCGHRKICYRACEEHGLEERGEDIEGKFKAISADREVSKSCITTHNTQGVSLGIDLEVDLEAAPAD